MTPREKLKQSTCTTRVSLSPLTPLSLNTLISLSSLSPPLLIVQNGRTSLPCSRHPQTSAPHSRAATSLSINRPFTRALLKRNAYLFWKKSGLKAGSDFAVGYSPERINPGDRNHRFETIKKVVSAQNKATLEIIADVYSSVVKAGIHKAPLIKVAEAAKVIENTQRDLNIALINELSAICHLLNIDTMDVLAAAQSKWNFLPFTPGLVGGHCIGVDPYYLTHRAEKAGYHPEVILAGRRINDTVGQRVAHECIKRLMRNGSTSKLVTVLGLTFKEDVPDIRNSRVVDVVNELSSFGALVQIHDPLASPSDASHEYGIELTEMGQLKPAEVVILAVPHLTYLQGGWPLILSLLRNCRGCVMDVKSRLDRVNTPEGIVLWRL